MTDEPRSQTDATRRLSERQSECLRLMARGRTPKEIATDLELSVETVHAHLKAARRTLAVGSSRQAAQMLAAAELPDGQTMGTQGFGIAGHGGDVIAGLQERGDPPARTMEDGVTVSDSWPSVSHQPTGSRTSPLSLGGRLDEMTPLQRGVLMGVALTAAVIVIAGLSAIATSLQSMLWSIYHGR